MGGSSNDDAKRRRRSRKHDDHTRSKHKRSRDSGRHTDRDRDRRKPSRRDKQREEEEEEKRLYDKARKYVEREEKKDSSRSKKDHHREKRGRSESSDFSEDDARTSRDRKRHRPPRKEHKKSSKKEKNHKREADSKEGSENRVKENHLGKKHGSKAKGSFMDNASPIDPSKLVFLGEVRHEPPPDKLDSDDYFSHNTHLRLFLWRNFGIYFEDLTSSESHHAFKEFIKAYNSGNLAKAYYDSSGGSFPQDALEQCSRTKHQWNFRTSKVEKESLSIVSAGVKKQTDYNQKDKAGTMNDTATKIMTYPKTYPITRKKIGPDRGDMQPVKTRQEIAIQRQADKQHRDRVKVANEEMYGVGKADPGWDRQREKRREQSEKIHGASKDRDGETWGGAELDDDAIYGTGAGRAGRGEPSYEEAVAKRNRYRARKEAEKAAQASKLLEKEEERQKKMLEMLGLSGIAKTGQKITIAPRNDNA